MHLGLFSLISLYFLPCCHASRQPWLVRPDSDHMYQFNNDDNSWLFAREKCLAQNADLASIEDEDEIQWIASHFPLKQSMRERYVFLGLIDQSGWGWLDGNELNATVTRWISGQPKEQAGGMDKCAMWLANANGLSVTNCDLPVNNIMQTRYVCERTPEQYKEILQRGVINDPLQWFSYLKTLGKLNELTISSETGLQITDDMTKMLDLNGILKFTNISTLYESLKSDSPVTHLA